MPKISRKDLINFPKSHAIIIGIDSYDGIGASLLTPITDAEALKEALTEHQGFENVHLWPDVTKQEIEDNLAALKASGTIGKKDCLLFYYAGHGLAGDLDGEGPAGYLMPSDVTPFSGELSTNERLVKMEWLFKQLQALNSHHTLLILDCCYAGAFRRINLTRGTKNLGLRPMTKLRFRRYIEKRAFQVLASAGPAEKAADIISDRGEKGNRISPNSPFAEALVKALSGQAQSDFKPAGKNLGDGVITANELIVYLHDEVERITRKSASLKPQNPDLFPLGKHDGGQFIFCDPRHPKSKPDWDTRKRQNPYKGLSQYDVGDTDFYFGRNTDIDNLQKIMQLDDASSEEGKNEQESSPTVLTITGPSGSGKSSLIKAGLLPLFRDKGYEVFQFRPGDRPWSIKTLKEDAWEEILQTTETPPAFIRPFGEIIIQPFFFDPKKKQVLYIDQFEEMFTTCTEEERQQLDKNLVNLLNAAAGQSLKIVISMRSDFEWQLELSKFGSNFWNAEGSYHDFYKLYRLINLGLDDLRSALVNPALLFAYEFEQDEQGDLTDTILEDLDYLPCALPLLSYTMQEMVLQTQKGPNANKRLFERNTYTKTIGGVSGALSKRMQAIYKSFGDPPPENEPNNPAPNTPEEHPITPEQELLRNVFLRMVSLSDGDYTRRRVYRNPQLDELGFAADNAAVKKVLSALRQADLISTGGDAGLPYEELIHDSLINTWTRGKQWINDFGKENLLLQRQLWQAVQDNSRAAPENNADNEHDPQIVIKPTVADSFMDDFSKLWDANPKLMQILTQVSQAAQPVLEQLSLEEILADYFADFPKEKQQAFSIIWQEYQEKKAFPDLNTLVLSGFSDRILHIMMEKGNHWLNQAEVAFIQQSWVERIADIVNLQRERDEAIRISTEAKAATCAAKAHQFHGEDNTVALNLALASHNLSPSEESSSALHDILSDPQTAFYHKVFTGHDAAILCVAISPDGQHILTGSDDYSAILWSISGDEVHTFGGHESPVRSVAFSPDGSSVLVGDGDGLTKLWSVSGENITSFYGHLSGISSLVFSPDGRMVLTGSNDKTAKLWSVSGEEVRTFSGHSKDVSSVAFSSDGQQVLTGSLDQTAKLWSVSGEEVRTFSGHSKGVSGVAFSSDGQQILTGSLDQTAKLWSVSGEEIQTFSGHSKGVSSVAFSPDGKLVLTGSDDHTARLWSVSGEELKVFSGHNQNVSSAVFLPDGQSILTGSWDKMIKRWPLLNLELQSFIESGVFSSAVFSPDGKSILTGSHNKTAKLWSVSGETLQVFEGHKKEIYKVAFSPDGQHILTGSGDKTAKLWSVSGEELQTFTGHKKEVLSVAFSSDGQRILTGSEDKTVKLWSVSGEELQTFEGHEKGIYGVAFSMDDKSILTASWDKTAKLWSESGEELKAFGGQKLMANHIVFSSDGQDIFMINWNDEINWWPISAEKVQTLPLTEGKVSSVALSSDGQTILTGSWDKKVSLWSASGARLHTFSGHNGIIRHVAFSPDGQHILTMSEDACKLWRNTYLEYISGTLWNHVHKLSPEEQAIHKIDWEY